MLGMYSAIPVEDVGLGNGSAGMGSVCPGQKCLISLCSVHLDPSDPTAGVLGIVPLDKVAVAGFLQDFVDSDLDCL